MNENLVVNEPYFDLNALAECKFPVSEKVKESTEYAPIQITAMPFEPKINFVEENVKTVHNFGKRLAGDISGANGLCLYEGNNKLQTRTEFLSPNLVKAERIKIYMKDGVEVAYRLFKKNFYVAAEDDSFVIYLTDMEKWSKINRVLAMNGISVTYTGRDAGQLFETYVNGITVSKIEYPYKSGWNSGTFMYNENGKLPTLKETPFLTKKLVTDSNLSIKKGFDTILGQLRKINDIRLRLFIFLLMHLVLLSEVMEIDEIKKTVFGLYGNIKTGNQIAKLFFQFFNRDSEEIHFLYDKEVVEKLDDCKDEIFAITDNFPETKYKRACAENNFSDIKDNVCKGRCEGICIFVSDYGIVTDDEEIFHLTVCQKDIEEVEYIKEAVGTHIKFFVEWLERNMESLKDAIEQSSLNNMQGRKKCYCNLFYKAYLIMEKFFEYAGGENLKNELGLKTESQVKQTIQQLVNKGFMNYHGSWICDQFKETFFELNFKRVRDKDNHTDFYGNEPFVYITAQYVCFRRKDFSLFLKDCPSGMHEIDILKALKKYGWLSTDNEKRYEKTVRLQKKPQKMIAVYKEFLFPYGTVEGGM